MRSNPVLRRLPESGANNGERISGRPSTLPVTVDQDDDWRDRSGPRRRYRRKKIGKFKKYPAFLKRLMKRYWGKTDQRTPYNPSYTDPYLPRVLTLALLTTLAFAGWLHHKLSLETITKSWAPRRRHGLGFLTTRRGVARETPEILTATRPGSDEDLIKIPLLYNYPSTRTDFHSPSSLAQEVEEDKDYGGLEIIMLEAGATRTISHDSHDDESEDYHAVHHKHHKASSDQDQYYAFDGKYSNVSEMAREKMLSHLIGNPFILLFLFIYVSKMTTSEIRTCDMMMMRSRTRSVVDV